VAHGRAKLRRRACAFVSCTSELEFGEEPPLNSIAFCADCEESPRGLKPHSFAGFSARLKPCPVTKYFGVRDLYASRARAAHGRAKLRRRMCAFSFCTSELEFGEEPPLSSIAFCSDCQESPQGLKPALFAGFTARLKPCPVTKPLGVRDLYASRARAAHGRAKLRRRMCALSFCTSELEFGEEPLQKFNCFLADCEELPQGAKAHSLCGLSARLKPCPVTKPFGVRDLYASRARAAHGRAKLRRRTHSTRPLARIRSGQAVRRCFSHVRVPFGRSGQVPFGEEPPLNSFVFARIEHCSAIPRAGPLQR
jgi:hypothetical protein